jgi:hypothetical protein
MEQNEEPQEYPEDPATPKPIQDPVGAVSIIGVT